MAAVIRRFVSPAGRLRRDEHERARAALAAVRDDVRPEAQLCIEKAIVELDRQAASSEREVFLMVYPEFSMVSEWLFANSSRKLIALRLWALILAHVDRETGDIALSRDEIAEALKVPADDVSRVMSELEECCAVNRRRVRVGGMRGPGMVRYAVNPLVGTHLPGKLREDARRAAPALKLAGKPGERRSRSALVLVPAL